MKRNALLTGLLVLAFLATIRLRAAGVIGDDLAVPGFFVFFILAAGSAVVTAVRASRQSGVASENR